MQTGVSVEQSRAVEDGTAHLPRDTARNGDAAAGRTTPFSTVEDMKVREQALATLLHVREPGIRLYRAAIEALAVCQQVCVAGVAFFKDDGADLAIDHAWFGGAFVAPFTWNISSGLLRDVVGANGSSWCCRLPAAELPGAHLISNVEEALLNCELITCGQDIKGFLFWVDALEKDSDVPIVDAIGHLIATRISAELDNEEERRARRRSEQQYQDVATTAFDWFWEMDANYRFTHFSERWRELTGLQPSKYLGKTVIDIGVDQFDPRWAGFLAALEQRRPLRGFGSRTVGANGNVFYWKINAKPCYGNNGEFIGYRGTGTDVTAEIQERRRAEKAERLLREAIESIPQGFCLFDDADKLVVVNQSFKRFYPDISAELVPGADFVDLVPIWAERTEDRPKELTAEELCHRRIRAHRKKIRNYEYQRADGRTFLVNEQKTGEGSSVWLHTDVTSLKQREAQLQTLSSELSVANQQMDITINSMTDGLVMYDSDDRLVLWNRHFKEMFGFGEKQLSPGLSSHAVTEHKIESGLISSQIEDYTAKRRAIREQGQLTYQRHLDDGRVLQVTGARMVDNGVVMTFQDVTLAESQAQAVRDGAEQLEALNGRLSKQNAYFDATLNSMTQGLATFDQDDRLMVCNNRYQKIFGLPDDLLLEGTSVAQIAEHIEQSGNWDNALGNIAGTHAQARQSGLEVRTMRFVDGRAYHVQNNLLENGDLLITFHEITDLEKQGRQLKAYAEKLEFSNRELEEFAYVASHDLQEPLRKIEAFGDRLLKGYESEFDETGRAYLERMQSASHRMRTLIRDLLDYSRIASEPRPFVSVDLSSVVDEVAADLEISFEASGGGLRHSDLPFVDADPTQMRQMFQNLISNAVKFRKPDVDPLIEITASRPSGGRPGAEQVEICVKDNGIGFDDKYADQVFKIFHRLHGRTEYEGTGIGLATCRKIIDRHGGSISTSSVPGEGTIVKIVLPVKQPDTEESRNA